MQISENEVHIYQYNISDYGDSSNLSYFENILSEDELAKAERFKFKKNRNEYISGRGYLRLLLGKYSDINPEELNFLYNEKGKPFLKNSFIKFNLAHSGSKAVYAVSKLYEIGIDIELRREVRDALEIADRFFSESEISDLKKIPENEISDFFLICWTRKEAFIKAMGEGLSYGLSDFSVNTDFSNPEIIIDKKIPGLRDNPDNNLWRLHNINAGEQYFSTLAVNSDSIKIQYKEIIF